VLPTRLEKSERGLIARDTAARIRNRAQQSNFGRVLVRFLQCYQPRKLLSHLSNWETADRRVKEVLDVRRVFVGSAGPIPVMYAFLPVCCLLLQFR
jgi:hypothetical protein